MALDINTNTHLHSNARLYDYAFSNNFQIYFKHQIALKKYLLFSIFLTLFFRYFPVANLTRTRQAVIIEPLRPEKFFVRTFNATSLYILSICEVCGSYQCPYCPFYSPADALLPSAGLVVILAAAAVYLINPIDNLLST